MGKGPTTLNAFAVTGITRDKEYDIATTGQRWFEGGLFQLPTKRRSRSNPYNP